MMKYLCLLLVAAAYGLPHPTQVPDPNSDILILKDLETSKPKATTETLKDVTIPNVLSKSKDTVTTTSDASIKDLTEKSCWGELGTKGVCVPYYTCTKVIDDNPDILFDIRGIRPPCEEYLDVCCLPANILPEITTTSRPTPSRSETQVNENCGHRNPEGVIGFDMTGRNDSNSSYFGEFPWMTAVLKVVPVDDKNLDSQTLNVYLGGGSLIHPSVVLTGAHVVHKDEKLKLRVRVGEWDTQTKNEILPHQDREIREIVIYPDFKNGSLHNDVALLFLSEPVDISPPHIGLACLPPAANGNAAEGAKCLASGWGKNQFGKEGRYQVVLKRTELPVVEHKSCQERLRSTRLGSHFRLDSSFMCAGGEVGQDTCVGDGGSPLVCPIPGEKDRYVQNGIVAWGIGCYQDGVPGVYVDVANFRTWIDETVAKYGYDTNTYAV